METIDIQNRSFVVRWLRGSRGDVIDYQLKPLKKSIELGIYKKPKRSVDGHSGSQVHIAPDTKTLLDYTTRSLLHRNNSMSTIEDGHGSISSGRHGSINALGHGSSVSTPSSLDSKKNHGSLSLSEIQQQSQEMPLRERLTASGFTLVKSFGTIHGNKMLQGILEVKDDEYYYAFILDNTSAKNAKKKVLFKAGIINDDDSCSLVSNRYSFSSDSTPKSAFKPKQDDPLSVSNGRYLQGFLLKKRRKKLQGFKRRFFSLDYKYGTLSYYLNDHNQTCRGEIVINLATVSANKKDKLIIIDSGMEIWALKGRNTESWEAWVKALQRCFELSFEKKPHPEINRVTYKNKNTENQTKKAPHLKIPEQENLNKQAAPYVPLSDESYSKFTTNLKLIQQRVEQCRKDSQHYISKDGVKNIYATSYASSSSFELSNPGIKEPIVANDSCDSLHSSTTPPGINCVEHPLYRKLLELENFLDQFVEQSKTLLSDYQYMSRQNKDKANSTYTSSISAFSDDEYFDAEDVVSHGVILLDNDETFDETNKLNIRSSESTSENEDEDNTEEEDNAMPKLHHEDTPTKQTLTDVDLYPLPWKGAVKRRNDVLPAFTAPPSLLSFLRKNVGKDLSSVAMPVTSNEPISILQMISEIFEYAYLLNNGISAKDSSQLLSVVSAFAISYLSVHRDKTRALRKPFNPLLGETFELVREDIGYRLVAEKVSHKPPVFAFFAEHEDWECSYTVSPVQKFWGKSIELNNEGTICLKYKNTKESFEWTQPTTMLKNLIAGERYVEPINEFEIFSNKSGTSTVAFRSAGMFGGRSEDVTVIVKPSNLPERTLVGKWTESLKDSKSQDAIWEVGNLVKDSKKKYGFTEFTANLNEITAIEEGKLPPTDSRLRPDIKAYENGDIDKAESLKLTLEQKQRERRGKGMDVKPKYFEKVSNGKWKIIRGSKGYWERRKRQDWSDVEPLW